MRFQDSKFRTRLMLGVAAAAASIASTAHAAPAQFHIPPQSLELALAEFAVQSRLPVLAAGDVTDEKRTRGVSGAVEPTAALDKLLAGTGLTYRRRGDTFLIVEVVKPKPAEVVSFAPETVTGSAVEGLTVTAQKRREAIQDVPIAISAFSQDMLEKQKIEGGFDLLKAIPNVTFSKNNFSSYNIAIRGIGTKAVSVATDPGVSMNFNSTSLIRNRLFEQEYFDIERVEVLRGPQGTLYGRNATGGVINVISEKAKTDSFAGTLKGEVGNYHTKRLSGFVNVPLLEDKLAVRFAGALTSREGYDYNLITQNAINGRDLWSARFSVRFEPTSNIRADLIWERFNEDDNRSRTGKQLCHRDDGPESIGDLNDIQTLARGMLSTGCKAGNMYDDGAFGTPNGLSIPFIQVSQPWTGIMNIGTDADGNWLGPIDDTDPYGGLEQSRSLREVSSIRDPRYIAEADIVELNFDWDITPSLTLTSQTAYNRDKYYSFQDFNRFNTVPVFNDTSSMFPIGGRYADLAPGGLYCDPQIGCSNSIAGFDISKADSEQISQELRIQSAFDGPLNFSAGANFTRYRTKEDYFVFYNLFTMFIQASGLFNGSPDITECKTNGPGSLYDPALSTNCAYIDPNPVENVDGEGHNYFRSQNPYTVVSKAAFGELYWQAAPELKVTAGVRYTDDRKTFSRIPTQLLLTEMTFFSGGQVGKGYPTRGEIKQQWGEWTGRLGVDWKPDLSFTDETMLYAFYSRGYKGGGANPPGIDFDPTPQDWMGGKPLYYTPPRSETFEPEYVHAFEVGTKNTLLGGGLTLNLGAFYYDYEGYQVSKILDRSAFNENFDAKVWGLEFESVFVPTEHLRFNASFGYQDNEIADGERSIDLMNRTLGNPDYVTLKPWPVLPSNCVAPKQFIHDIIAQNRVDTGGNNFDIGYLLALCPGSFWNTIRVDTPYDQFPNEGQGFYTELGGNKLPNAPHYTVSLGGEFDWSLLDEWTATVRGDFYWQSQSWARVYNLDPYDKLHAWSNVNLALIVEKPEADLAFELYAKNVFDEMPITDSFLNSDDAALTTNVFTLDPRLIGLKITKGF